MKAYNCNIKRLSLRVGLIFLHIFISGAKLQKISVTMLWLMGRIAYCMQPQHIHV